MRGYQAGMSDPDQAPRVSLLGYAIGVGSSFTAVAGAFVRFAFAAAPDVLLLGGSFLVGAALGALRPRARRVDLFDRDASGLQSPADGYRRTVGTAGQRRSSTGASATSAGSPGRAVCPAS